jgi:hypothetical protein
MITSLGRERCLILLAAIAWGWTAGVAAAQAPDQQPMTTSSLTVMKSRVPVGDVVYVTDTAGHTIKGKLAAVTDDAVQVDVRADRRNVATTDIRRIQWQQRDSPLTGVLIGAAVGAVPGLYWLVADPNECTGLCPEEYAFIAVGAVVGGVIDHVIKRRVTVYTAEASSSRATSVAIGPLVTRARKGLQVAVRF